ncbi:HIT domain-containing protein [Candidatus Methylacidiphilum fumarolicum]|uniref:HIT family hydrolase n=2 Tax=Candidatus Methylacidiphilum fumarolicum TaxID=591154 RepID=I0JX09_METFB|nr:HIT domain-containing protein [Candidatus Methylacidiphilum fumarolicum]MBW6414469.1 HIT domain-containing protein [Candidatus Methylacidiphilum fumarolicum]TFE69469.1 HIT family hydrolase [Candidatus Methylacidiphilum fumarolicum]TFE72830.1 HIT domain-containing protein [Candidatus Methylacidiphilum fumarolicum]TFE74574.1 HIT domain-containing protein [Candidatus Methylacidiphilum fumarolicum]TFE77136.1 HIT family hydrolase [Candidatus Methylacidiphilum fumarolicum]
MEHLWAPWRKAYFERDSSAIDHLFEIIAQSSDDEKNFVLTRGKTTFSLLNRYPYNTAHCMVVPYRIIKSITELTDTEMLECFHTLNRLCKSIQKLFSPHGFNVGLNVGAAAGAGIESHLHWHLVPRWKNDTNFITTIGNTRVHPDDLPTVYRLLREDLSKDFIAQEEIK